MTAELTYRGRRIPFENVPDDPGHGRVLELAPGGARLHALIRGSERWSAGQKGYRIEGEVLLAIALGPIRHACMAGSTGGDPAAAIVAA